jgi:SET domain-containing protein
LHYNGLNLFSNRLGFGTIFGTIRKMAAHAFIAEPRIDPRFACFRLKLGRSGIHGWGVYAAERIPARHKVIEYTGERISRRETRRRGLGPRTYLFTLDNYWTLDGAVGGSGAELVNHSCNPNLYSWVFKGHILYMSKRDIRAGEELTVDYHFSDKIDEVPCRCGSAQCRGTINIKTARPSKT